MDVLCSKCGKSFPVDERRAGPEATCPQCHATVRVPTLSSDASAFPAGEESEEFLIKARLALKKKMLVVCPGCSLRMIVRQKMSGKLIQCPACSHQVTVPVGFMPAEGEASEFVPAEAVQAPAGRSTFQMPAIAIYEDSSPVRWLAAAVAAIVVCTAAGFATGYFLMGSRVPAAPAQPAAVAPSAGSAAPSHAAPAAPENRLIR